MHNTNYKNDTIKKKRDMKPKLIKQLKVGKINFKDKP